MVDNMRRNRAYGFTNALQKLNPLPILAKRNPTTNDRGFPIGKQWINQINNSIYALTSISNSLANWEVLGSTGAEPITQYVVDADGSTDYTTVQLAVDAANTAGGGMVYVRPGIYTENLILYDNIMIQGAGLETTITGIHLPPAAGQFTFYDLTLTSATDILSSIAAGTTTILLFNCLINCTNGYTFNLLNWTGILIGFDMREDSTNNGSVNNTGGASIFFINLTTGNGAGNTMVTSGVVELYNVIVQCPVDLETGTTGFAAGGCYFENTIITAGNSIFSIYNSSFVTGANTAIVHNSTGTLTMSNTTIDSSADPVIAGTGTGALTLGSVTLLDGRNIVGGLTYSDDSIFDSAGLAVIESSTNSAMGATSLVAGTVTINTTRVTASSRIYLTPQGVLAGVIYISARVAGTSFTITSTNGADTPIVAWMIVEPR